MPLPATINPHSSVPNITQIATTRLPIFRNATLEKTLRISPFLPLLKSATTRQINTSRIKGIPQHLRTCATHPRTSPPNPPSAPARRNNPELGNLPPKSRKKPQKAAQTRPRTWQSPPPSPPKTPFSSTFAPPCLGGSVFHPNLAISPPKSRKKPQKPAQFPHRTWQSPPIETGKHPAFQPPHPLDSGTQNSGTQNSELPFATIPPSCPSPLRLFVLKRVRHDLRYHQKRRHPRPPPLPPPRHRRHPGTTPTGTSPSSPSATPSSRSSPATPTSTSSAKKSAKPSARPAASPSNSTPSASMTASPWATPA